MSQWTKHGGKLESARSAYPCAPRPWLDLSTGVNAQPWPGIPGISINWQSLPEDGRLKELEDVAARYFACRGESVCALPGTESGLRALRNLGLPTPFRHAWPGYITHSEALAGSLAMRTDQLLTGSAAGGTLLFGNPSNPNGHLIEADEVLAAARSAQASGGWLIVDEAFIDPHLGASIVPLLRGSENVIVLRSFGKFFGLAGVRLGFAIGPSNIIATWRDMLGSWPLSGGAIEIGIAAYNDTGWIERMRIQLQACAAAADRVFRRHGLQPMGASPLFRLVECDAPILFEGLARRGILTRPFEYERRWLRFGVPGNAADLARLDAALEEIAASG